MIAESHSNSGGWGRGGVAMCHSQRPEGKSVRALARPESPRATPMSLCFVLYAARCMEV